MHITLRQLEVFAEVLKSGSTTQASVMLALSQSAVSAALTDLEGQLGVQLFDRVGKRLVVNEHGRLLYPRALALLEQAVEIEQLFREDNGAIRIYASSTIGNYILPAVIARYRHDYPQLPIELSVGNSQDVMQAGWISALILALLKDRATALKSFLNRGWKTSWWFSPRRLRRWPVVRSP